MKYLIRKKYLVSVLFLLIPIVIGLISACSPSVQFSHLKNPTKNHLDENPSFSEAGLFKSLLQKAGCGDFSTHAWSYIYQIVSIEKGQPPPYYTVKEKIAQQIQKQILSSHISKEKIEFFAKQFVKVYAYITEFMQNKQSNTATEILVYLEHGIIHPEHKEFVTKLQNTLTELNQSAKALNKHCSPKHQIQRAANEHDFQNRDQINNLKDQWSIPFFSFIKNRQHPLIYGALKVMSTAYQSCSVLDIPLMPTQHKTQGIRLLTKNRSGGWKREIFDLKAVIRSHYYISKLSTPSNEFTCFDIYSNPMVFNFGGKPAIYNQSIDLFRNIGSSSSKTLGIDCSGFVTTAMAGAGLRLKNNMAIRPIHVQGINSRMFKNAQQYQLSCLQKQDISLNNPLKPGDIIASNAHIAIVEYVASDPFNIDSIYQSQNCHSTSINTKKFRFSIIQSSAHNTVGINRMSIAHAFNKHSNFGKGLQKIASRLCYKKFGMDVHKNIHEISILRHSTQEPSCRNKEVHLKNQECLRSCPQRLI